MKHQLRSRRPLRYLVVSLLVAALALAVYACGAGFGGRLSEVVIEIEPTHDGLFLIQNKDIERRLDDSPFGSLLGQPVNQVPLEQLEAYLTADPFVEKAELYVRFDGTLNALIHQHEPILRVHHRSGPDYYVSPRGEIVPLSKHSVARVPVLTGDVRPFAKAVKDSTPIQAYELAIAISQDELLGPLIEQIDLKNGEYTLIPKLGSGEFLIGSLDHLQAKLKRLHAFIEGVYPEVGWDKYKRIDLRYEGLAFGQRFSV